MLRVLIAAATAIAVFALAGIASATPDQPICEDTPEECSGLPADTYFTPGGNDLGGDSVEITSAEARSTSVPVTMSPPDSIVTEGSMVALVGEKCRRTQKPSKRWDGTPKIAYRELTLFTRWCYLPGVRITFRKSIARSRVDGVCPKDGPAQQWRQSGGIGQSHVVVHAEAPFRCPTPWWFDYHVTSWINVIYDVYGRHSVLSGDG